ncbi:NUDIX domain-containing protein, partial [Enterococcus faecalis]|nr:NUDIX domain-containing protein [Enterococcus faecalis]
SLPGGYAEIGCSPKENIEKEVLEETGLVVTAKELLAVYDTDKRKDIPQLFQYYKMIFSCAILENHPFEKNIETSNCAYFSLDNLPSLSIKRTTKEQLMALMNQTTGALSD